MPVPPLAPRVDEAAIRALAKAEVHVHLEGTFQLADLLELARAAGEPLPGPAATLFDLSTHTGEPGTNGSGSQAKGLSGYLEFLDWEGGLVRTAEQAARHAYRFAARESESGVRYADVIVNLTHWPTWRGRFPQLLAALGAGFDEAEQDGFAAVGVCVSLDRQQTAADGAATARMLVAERPHRVVALSIDGDETRSGRTGARFAEAFTIARDGGLHRTVHAGESSGPDGIWDAIDLLHAERIDHGVRAIEDPRLVATLIERGISLGVCPRSNVTLGMYPSWAEHPLPRLLEAGVAVTINTDDPAPLGARLDADWSRASAEYGWDLDVLRRFAVTSIEASFAPAALKTTLLAELSEEAVR
jgi:adenosine deaminase